MMILRSLRKEEMAQAFAFFERFLFLDLHCLNLPLPKYHPGTLPTPTYGTFPITLGSVPKEQTYIPDRGYSC
jgi:hypothetical protein